MTAYPQPMRLRFTVDEFYKMFELGILSESGNVELIEGEIFEQILTQEDEKRFRSAAEILTKRLEKEAIVRVKSPLRISSSSEFLPHVSILKSCCDFYEKRLPQSADVLLTIEFTPLKYNYTEHPKALWYAAAEIPEIWFANAEAGFIEVCTNQLRQIRIFRRGDTVRSESVPNLQIEVDKILG